MQMQPATVTRLVQPKLAALLDECRELAVSRLPASLQCALDKVDDALFALANKADSSQKQGAYFDAMRELRLKRQTFTDEFLDSFTTEFENTTNPQEARNAEQQPVVAIELALLDSDEVEQSLALTNFVDSVRTRCREELFALDQRIGFLLSDPESAIGTNPLGPQAIGTAFKVACQQLNSDVEIKLTLFKLFDKFAGPTLVELYQEINRRLIEGAILPKIETRTRRPTTSGHRTKVTIESESESAEAAGEDVFSVLQQLMRPGAPTNAAGDGGSGFSNTLLGSPSGSGGAPGSGGVVFSGAPMGSLSGYGGAPGNGGGVFSGAPMGSPSVHGGAHFVHTLTRLQQGDVSAIESGALSPTLIEAGNVNVLSALRETGAIGALSQTDGLTLDIVSILFDYILDDPAIPDTMKALIGRLQIPVLKVALIDKELFSKKSHPARRLLDALAVATVGWTAAEPPECDALHEMVVRAVRTIVDEFDEDIALFETVLGEFLAFVENEDASAQQRAQTSVDSLHGKERIVMAKLAVDDEVHRRLAGREVREFIRRFVLDYWRQLLIITHVENGADSEQWKDQLETIDELVWSVQAKTTRAERKGMTERLPQLIKAIKSGMKTLEMDPAECSKVLSMLASIHVVSVKTDTEATLAERRLQDKAGATAAEPVAADGNDLYDPNESEEFIKQGLARLFERKGVEPQELDIDLTSFEDIEQPGEDTEPEMEPGEGLQSVMTLDLGEWIEFENERGGMTRARFTWISPATGRYLFTTRAGCKALDTSMQELAREFRRGTARKIESRPDPLFDRAIGNLMDKLERRAS